MCLVVVKSRLMYQTVHPRSGVDQAEYGREIVNLVLRHLDAGRSRRSAALLAATVGCAVVLAVIGWDRLGSPAGAARRVTGSRYVLMQLNLCLSGLADCYDKAAYPAGVQEAVARIRDARPDAVTLNEACSDDAARLARRTGYHLRFSQVENFGSPLLCIRPTGRGAFGDAVLTKAAIDGSADRPFHAESLIEQRRWLCVSTARDVDVCTAHLSVRRSDAGDTTNDAQCGELTALLVRKAATRTVIFGGDVNRLASCAPTGAWTRTDGSADQDPGIQHVYGSRATLRTPSTQVVPFAHSDHDALLVRARLTRR